MFEKFDLKNMMEEIAEDKKSEKAPKSVILSQEDIKQMIKERQARRKGSHD
jgi:hypothetical protein